MPESGVTKHNYLFCQFFNPECGHEGDRCDCFDTPNQQRTTLVKQRLARLRANRNVNRASTSGTTESAVASDPAVTAATTEVRQLTLAELLAAAAPAAPAAISHDPATYKEAMRSADTEEW